MTLSFPPPGGVTCMSRSTPAGGQITPFDWASLSLRGSELPPPTVGGSPLTSGGHAAPCSGGALRSAGADCAQAAPANATFTIVARIRTARRKVDFSPHNAALGVAVYESTHLAGAAFRTYPLGAGDL